jgi:hypothetical protein
LHPSKASDTYYYWNYSRYFSDICQVLTNLKRLARKKARGAMVVQNSFYKELVVATPTIIVEMAEQLGFRSRVARREIVRSHIGVLSPRQTRYVPRKVLEECVLRFEFP